MKLPLVQYRDRRQVGTLDRVKTISGDGRAKSRSSRDRRERAEPISLITSGEHDLGPLPSVAAGFVVERFRTRRFVPSLDRPYTRASMMRLLPVLAVSLFTGPLLAQTSTSSYSQTVHLTRSEQQVETHLTRVISRVSGGPNLYDKSFNLPISTPEVQTAFAEARNLVKASPAIALDDAVNSLTDVSTRVITEQTNAIKTIGRTRRETMGPATVIVGALATEASPCTGYAGGLPMVNGGLSPDDGFFFKFTTPLAPSGCPLEGTPFLVADGVLNVDTLIHIHTDIYQTTTTIRTTRNSSTYEIVGTRVVFPPTSPYAPEVPSILVRYVRNLDRGDSVINITNSGARGAGLAAGTTASTTGAICVNVYALSAEDEMIHCCSCPVTPNGLLALSARRDFVNNLTSPKRPTSLVVKLYATVPTRGTCSTSAADNSTTAAPGLHAWGTSIQIGAEGKPDPVTESPFLVATLGPGERERLVSRCAFINANGSGFSICSTCRFGSFSFR